MNIELKGEMDIEMSANDTIGVSTPNGFIVISVADDGSFTTIRAAHREGHKLRFQPQQNSHTGQQDALTIIEPMGGLSS